MQNYPLKSHKKVVVRLILFIGLFGAVLAAFAAEAESNLSRLTAVEEGQVVTLGEVAQQEVAQQEDRAPHACPSNPTGLPDTIERTDFCVFYDDSDTTDAQATQVADLTQSYWDRYVALGFLEPHIKTGDKLEVHINDASCNGSAWDNHIKVNNGCFSITNSMDVVVGHEVFHRIQMSYDTDWETNAGDHLWFFEGTARATEDKTFATIDSWAQAMSAAFSFNQELNDYLANTNSDLTSNGMRYESAMYWTYFMEQYGTDPDQPEMGIDAVETLWDATASNSDIAALNIALGNLGAGENFNSSFRKFTAANWLKDLDGASSAYNYQDEDEVGNPAPYGPIIPASAGPINNGSSPATWNNQAISRYGSRYYRTQIGNSCSLVSVDVNTDSGPAFYHIITEESQPGNNQLGFFDSNTATSWNRSFFNDGSIDFVTVIAGSTNNGSTVDISVDCADPVIDIKLPNNGAVANVGPSGGPGKFLAQVLVTDGSAKGPVIDGLTINDFKAAVGGIEALVTGSGFVQEQYWLVIQAPTQAADGLYPLEIRLEESGTTNVIATDTNDASVNYTPDNVDHLLIVDRSGSMNSDGKFVAAKNAANFYIDITRNNDGLAVIPFSDNQTPAAFNLTEVTTVPNVRHNAENYVDSLNIGNLTSIGDGLDEAVTQRNTTPTSNPLCSFVLMSDGIETANKYWTEVDTDVIATGCPVTTIAFGSAADETLMQDIATATGGAFYFNDVFVSTRAPGAATSIADTNLGLGNTYEYAQAESEGRVRLLQERGEVPILQSEFELPPDQIHKVYVDDTVGEVVFSLDWYSINEPDCDNSQVSNGCFGKDLQLKLVQPDGKIITSSDIPYTFADVVSGHVGWRIEKPMEGEWTLIVNADSFYVWYEIPYQVIVSGPSYLTAELLLADQTGIRYFTGDQVPIHAFVSSNKPLAGASVIAEVTGPDGQLTPVVLYDDGQHGDGEADDGFYAGLYTRVNQAEVVGPQGEDGGKPTKRTPDEGSYQVRLLVKLNDIMREALGSFSVAEAPDENQNGIPDPYERENGIDSAGQDKDLDGLDAASEYQLGTDPNNSDTDGGGENDGSEWEMGLDPLDPKDDKIEAPAFLKVTPNVGFNQILYDVREDYVRMILFRAISPDGPWLLRNSELPEDGRYRDKAENGQTYYYRYLAVNKSQHVSAVIGSEMVKPSEDPFAPEAYVVINDGAVETDSLIVNLDFEEDTHEHGDDEPDVFDDIIAMKISNSPLMEDAKWIKFEQNYQWQLAEDTIPGSFAKVYAMFQDGAGNESTISTDVIKYVPKPDGTNGNVDVLDIPIEFHRRAAQLIEEMRGSPMAPGWEEAMLDDRVRELCRPDVKGVAYYEFKVVNPDGSDKGFIVLSTGDHDFPIAHWNYEGETPTENVERVAAKDGKKVVKFYKLDTLTYAGDDENGDLAAMPGTQMVKISGLEMGMIEDVEEFAGSSEWVPNEETENDNADSEFEGTKKETGEPNKDLVITGWDSWKELKEGYAESYGVLAEGLKQEAANDWEIDVLAETIGEGLFKGETYDFTLLMEGKPEVGYSGAGASDKYVDTEIIAKEGMPTVLRIVVKDAVPGQELPLNVTLDYSQQMASRQVSTVRATQETLKFVLLDPQSLPSTPASNTTVFLPMVSNNSSPQSNASMVPQNRAINGGWGAWNFFWAGNHGDQRAYTQMHKSDSVNTSSCYSGCGGTAWAMLFGWADNQAAEGNGYWAPRWGLYRQNGGKGSNAVAPSDMQPGVKNMTWEIRNDIGTWCAGNSGPTFPWDMDQATDYLNGRTGTKLSTHYNSVGIHESRLRNYARNSIVDRDTPAIIGTGWLNHYPLAYGYAWRSRTVRKCFIVCWNETQYNRSFYVNQGWGGSGDGWVSSGTWFAGEIRP